MAMPEQTAKAKGGNRKVGGPKAVQTLVMLASLLCPVAVKCSRQFEFKGTQTSEFPPELLDGWFSMGGSC
jgi:hypothetical protein